MHLFFVPYILLLVFDVGSDSIAPGVAIDKAAV